MTNNKIQFNVNRYFQIVAIFCLILLMLKMASIGFYSSRFFDIKGAPFTEIGHEGFHRFMDWILVYDVAHYKDFFDLSSPEYTAPPVPYSILVFWFMKLGLLFKSGHWYLFVLVVIANLYTSYLLFASILKFSNKENRLLLFLTLIVSSYPLWYAIDRGNADLIAVVIFNCIILNEIEWKKQNLTIYLISLVVSLKPSWGLFGLLLFLGRFNHATVLGLLWIALVYSLPMLIWGHNYDYLIVEIKKAYPMISGMNFLCNNITCSIRVFTGIPNDSHDKLITIFGLCSILISFYYLKYIKKNLIFQRKFSIMLILIYICTLLINNPSADFRLNIFFCLLILTFSRLRTDVKIMEKDYIILIIGYILIFGFTNIPFKNTFYYFTLLRTLGVFLLGYILLKLNFSNRVSTND